MKDQPTFGHIGSGFEANNYPHLRTDADVEAANAETASAEARGELTLPPVVQEIAVNIVKAEAVMVPVTLTNTAEIERAL